MKKLVRGFVLALILTLMMSMTVFATGRDPVVSPELPGDDLIGDEDDGNKNDLPGDEHLNDRSPKTNDDRAILYVMAMTAIAAAGTIVIAKKKEA